jgi:cytochrome b involved in lipid metabolism
MFVLVPLLFSIAHIRAQFLPDHPGGEKAILIYAGRDATEEFNMLHDPKVIPRYAPDAVIGSVKN